MAYENILFDWTFPANADLSSSQFRAVTLGSNGNVAVVAAAGADAVGILQDKPAAAGRAAQVRVLGISKAIAGAGGVSVGDRVKTDASGGVITTSTAGDVVIGRVLVAAAAGETATILLVGNYSL